MPVILFARFIQAIADNSMWIAGLAMITDIVPSHHFGQIMAFLSVAVCVGTSACPIIAGLLFEKCGYWAAWSSAFLLLFVDFVMRILMIEGPKIDISGKSFLFF